MKKSALFICAVLGLFCSVTLSSAQAGLVTAVSSDDLSAGTVSLVSSTATNIEMNLTVLKNHTPFAIIFTSAAGAGSNLYTVKLNVTNAITGGGASGDYMNGFDITELAADTNGVTSGLQSDTPTSDYFALEMVNGADTFNLPAPDSFRFGGINGGGAALYNGDPTVSVTFKYLVSKNGNASPGTSRLNFTANPEPATLLLGSLAMIPAGVALRRRRKAQQDVVEAV